MEGILEKEYFKRKYLFIMQEQEVRTKKRKEKKRKARRNGGLYITGEERVKYKKYLIFFPQKEVSMYLLWKENNQFGISHHDASPRD